MEPTTSQQLLIGQPRDVLGGNSNGISAWPFYANFITQNQTIDFWKSQNIIDIAIITDLLHMVHMHIYQPVFLHAFDRCH